MSSLCWSARGNTERGERWPSVSQSEAEIVSQPTNERRAELRQEMRLAQSWEYQGTLLCIKYLITQIISDENLSFIESQ